MSPAPACRPGGMGKVITQITVSVDGYAAGPDQSEEHPLGLGGERLHEWYFGSGAPNAIDAPIAEALLAHTGAYVMGRNMFGPVRGGWEGTDWRGWWGEDPPYHAPVFVLTHHARDPLPMAGGTTFHFVTEGLDAALEQARAAAGELDVQIAGGASTVNQALAAGALDELHLHVAPFALGAGERLFDGVGDLRLEPLETVHSPAATHVRYRVVR
jgi:dihydrofolate reductase